MTELKDFIVRTRIDNQDENMQWGNPDFDTNDFVFFEKYADFMSDSTPQSFYAHPHISNDEITRYLESNYKIFTTASDYAVASGANQTLRQTAGNGYRTIYLGPACNFWLRSGECVVFKRKAYDKNGKYLRDCYDKDLGMTYVSRDGIERCNIRSSDCELAARPALKLDLNTVLSSSETCQTFNIKPFYDNEGNILYHTLDFGFYPQERPQNADQIEQLYQAGELTPTGKTYVGAFDKNENIIRKNSEFEYAGKKYVRTDLPNYVNLQVYKDGMNKTFLGSPAHIWTEVQPIRWIISNWDKLPQSINPEGNGTATTIDIRTEDAILGGIPYYFEQEQTKLEKFVSKMPFSQEKDPATRYMWQNSVWRAYLNGYNLGKELSYGNGNKKFIANQNFDFEGQGFLQEAFEGYQLQSSITPKHQQEPQQER